MKAVGVAAICFIIAGLIVILVGQDFLYLLSGFSNHHEVITSAQYTVASLLLAPMTFSVGLVLLVGKQATSEDMKNASARTMKWSSRYMIFVAVSIVAAMIAPVVQYQVVDSLARQRGYVPCPKPDRPRHQPDRWALPGADSPTGHCPGDGANPNF
ncbi:hypothetical protein KZX46_12790 [Polymorphobacter sp. PAMC 29334]|uniref:hypothetical protein n=1 Tax=Polymorphobacter sp. PAMC 29334 TaxID=2862331 RepID=UPI001C771F07|nr:hypothetical protein [Polymorphobacter sp. PAMC 29334]QYE33725.1 hypothetical protein KZX46_12790 [Polymorphobacter sp. PAMC 29334]